ncbi:hypothetical protein CC2G_001484 [Coprinopsis cinerea AmutBmut pab1-1]|nr:hypothetical protein CC2G_001484 [Coprinopsis cinerea AmutBmut pab1-1]
MATPLKQNATGFTALPDELLLDILIHLDTTVIRNHGTPALNDPIASQLREFTIISLIQTCQSLRRFFLPYLWQRIQNFPLPFLDNDAGFSSASERQWEERSTTSIKRLDMVIDGNPYLANYVQIVNVYLYYSNLSEVLAKLVKVLSICPQVHTLQLTGSFYGISRLTFNSLFSAERANSLQFPTINTAFFTPLTIAAIQALPNLRHLHWHSPYGWQRNELLNA